MYVCMLHTHTHTYDGKSRLYRALIYTYIHNGKLRLYSVLIHTYMMGRLRLYRYIHDSILRHTYMTVN